MSRDKRYQGLLNSRRWLEVKAIVWKRAQGLCERCKAEGFITPGVDVHHIKPVETGRTVQEMERLAYNPNNCQLLCVPCHIKVHHEMRTHTKEKVQENKERARRRFMEANDPNWRPDEPTDDTRGG
jgi:5-methylcytosine-specific restriction endonuclease McrA